MTFSAALAALALSVPSTGVAPNAEAERVTFGTADGLELVADFHDVKGSAPTVICLPMYRSSRKSYEPIVAPLKAAGVQVLALDLRGHGDSAPQLKDKVAARDAALFNAMYEDVAAAWRFLKSRGEDTSRVSLLGASVGCSVGIDAIVRNPSAYRSIVLMTPGADYLGVDTLAQLAGWPDVPSLVLTSKEEEEKVAPVAEVLKDDAPEVTTLQVFDGGGIHGTRMFGKVPGVQTRIVDFYKRTLLSPALAIPSFDADDPRVTTGGFFGETLRVSRTRGSGDAEETFTLMTFAVGDTLTVGAMTKQAFGGEVRVEVGGRAVTGAWSTESKEPVSFAPAGSGATPLSGEPGSFRGHYWVNVAVPVKDWLPERKTTLRLVFTPKEGEPIAIPGGDRPFQAYFAER